MFFLLQTAEVIGKIQEIGEGVVPGSNKAYEFIVIMLSVLVFVLIFGIRWIYKIKHEEVLEVRKDYKELSEKSVILMGQVNIRLEGGKKMEDDVHEIKLNISAIEKLLSQ